MRAASSYMRDKYKHKRSLTLSREDVLTPVFVVVLVVAVVVVVVSGRGHLLSLLAEDVTDHEGGWGTHQLLQAQGEGGEGGRGGLLEGQGPCKVLVGHLRGAAHPQVCGLVLWGGRGGGRCAPSSFHVGHGHLNHQRPATLPR